jgi:hypothetical protein
MLGDPSPEAVSVGAKRLEVILGVDRGAALAIAVRSAIAH